MGLRDLISKTPPPSGKGMLFSSGSGDTEDKAIVMLAKAFGIDKEIQKKGKGRKKVKDADVNVPYRIPFHYLEKGYRIDGISQRCTNFYVNMALGGGYTLLGKTKYVKMLEAFKVHSELHDKEEEILRDSCVCGNGWWEKVRNPKNEIVDVQRINFKRMDYMRDVYGKVIEDEAGNPAGYQFGKAPITSDLTGVELRTFTGEEMNDIVHLKMFSLGLELPHGFIEPVFRDVFNRLNIKASFAQSGWRTGNVLYGIVVGDRPNKKTNYRGYPATPQAVSEVRDEFQNIQNKHKLVYPYWVEVKEISKGGDSSAQLNLLEYFDKRIATTGFGLPISVALGEGGSNAAGMGVESARQVLPTIKWLQKKMTNILMPIFTELVVQSGGRPEDTPTIKWNDNIPEDLNKKSKRIVQYVEAKVLKPTWVTDMVLREEGIKVEQKDVDDYKKKFDEMVEKAQEANEGNEPDDKDPKGKGKPDDKDKKDKGGKPKNPEKE